VNETIPGVCLIGDTATAWGVTRCRWWLDRPVSNSGRLKTLILEQAKASGWEMTVELDFNPDRVLSECSEVVATSDGIVLERCCHWVNLAGRIIAEKIETAWLLKLAPGADAGQLGGQDGGVQIPTFGRTRKDF